jgi:hypothetical protein
VETRTPYPPDREFELLLTYVKRSRGFDFTGYKRASLVRRIQKRMQMLGIEGYGEYTDYLQVHPDEFTRLFDTILINVTGFFRDITGDPQEQNVGRADSGVERGLRVGRRSVYRGDAARRSARR